MKILAMSDIHTNFDEPKFAPGSWPQADLIIIAGDLCVRGKLWDGIAIDGWLYKVMYHWGWYREDRKPVWCIPGNHDIGYPDPGQDGSAFNTTAARTLEYRRRDFGGLSFYGVPLTTAYLMPELATQWVHMTNDPAKEAMAFDFEPVDVVVSHGPPYGVLDNAGIDLITKESMHLGSRALLAYMERHSPKLVICGHVHCSAGAQQVADTWVYNVAENVVLIDTDNLGEWTVL